MRLLFAATITTTILASMATSAMAQKRGNPNPGVLPPHSRAFGQTYGEWGADWWNWAFSSPLAENPLTDTTGENCHANQPDGPVWFLAGFLDLAGTEGPVVRECTVPTGKALFFPVYNRAFIATDGESEEEARAAVNAGIDQVSVLEASINGVPLQDLWRYRAESPAYTQILPEGAIIDELVGISGEFLAVTDGYWLMLAPLPVGEYVIRFRGAVGDPANPDFAVEVIYLLTVAPRG